MQNKVAHLSNENDYGILIIKTEASFFWTTLYILYIIIIYPDIYMYYKLTLKLECTEFYLISSALKFFLTTSQTFNFVKNVKD